MNPSAQYSSLGHGSYRSLHPQQQQHAQPHYPHQAPMPRLAGQQQQQQAYGSLNGPAAATATAAAKNIPPNYGAAPAAGIHPQYPHAQGTPVMGGVYGAGAPIRPGMYPSDSMGQSHQQQQLHQQQQPQQQQPQAPAQPQQQAQQQQAQPGAKPYPYSMQPPYSVSAQHYSTSDSSGPSHATQQQPQQDMSAGYSQQQQPPATQHHPAPHYR